MDSRDRRRAAGPRLTGPLDALAQRGIAGAANLFVQSVDLNEILGHIDLDAVLNRVNVDRLLERVDVNALIARVDLDKLLARVDLDAILSRVDVDALLDRVDLSDLIAKSSADVASDTVKDVMEDARGLGESADRWVNHLFHHEDTSETEPLPAEAPPQGSVPASEDTGQPGEKT